MKFMVIDIGSNTVKYDVYTVKAEGCFLVAHCTYPAQLIGKIENGALTEGGEELLIGLLKKFNEDALRLSCDDIFCFATAGLRKVSDPAPLLKKLGTTCGIAVRVLSGEEEAAYSFKGMLLTLSDVPSSGMMLDMGGGSTEINFFKGTESVYLHSCPFGASILKRTFSIGDKLNTHQAQEIASLIDRFFPQDLPHPDIYGKTAVLVGGTGKTAAKLAKKLCSAKMSGAKLALADFYKIFALMSDPTPEEYAAAKEIAPDRYRLMASGLCGYTRIFEKMNTEILYIAPGGVREGYLATVLCKDMKFYL